MKAYYCINEKNKSVFYIPNNVIGISEGLNFNFDFNPDTLQGLALLFQKRFLSLEELMKKNWNVYEEDIPERFIRDFQNMCFKNFPEPQLYEKVYEILDYVSDVRDYKKRE